MNQVLLLMAEILHHLECENLVNNGITYLSTGAGFLSSTVSWLWIFPAAWCVPQWRSSVKKPPHLGLFGRIFSNKKVGPKFSKKWIPCAFLLCFLVASFANIYPLEFLHVFQLRLAKTFQNCSDHPFFVLIFLGEERHLLMSWKVNFHHQLTPPEI